MVADSGKQAVANAHAVATYSQGMCLMFVRDPCWRIPSFYGSAIDAWYGAKHKHPGDRSVPLGGCMMYEGGQYGHAVINVEDKTGRMRSTDCTKAYDVSDTDIDWPVRTWGYRYLGWCSDLNGVDLPLGKEDDEMPLTDDDLERIAKRVNAVLGDYNADGTQRDKGDPDDPDRGDERMRQIETTVRHLEGKVDRILKAVEA